VGTEAHAEVKRCVLVASSGGVGSSALFGLLHELGFSTNDPHDHDRLKHGTFASTMARLRDAKAGTRLRRGWDALTKGECSASDYMKVVYVFGDPVHAVWSILRRGLGNEMQKRTRAKPLADDSRGLKFLAPCLRKQQLLHRSFSCQSPEKYLAAGEDLLELEAHFDGWRDGVCGIAASAGGSGAVKSGLANGGSFPGGVLFLRSDTMWKHVDDLLSFLHEPIAEGYVAWESAKLAVVPPDSVWRRPYMGSKSDYTRSSRAPVAGRLANLYRGFIEKQTWFGELRVFRTAADCK
jgi:hypothetical protein